MTTRLERPVAREVFSPRFGALVVTLTRDGIELREKGRRKRYLVLYGKAYQRAVADEAAQLIAERKAKRRRASASRSLLRA